MKEIETQKTKLASTENELKKEKSVTQEAKLQAEALKKEIETQKTKLASTENELKKEKSVTQEAKIQAEALKKEIKDKEADAALHISAAQEAKLCAELL
jgi:chromosome segregation ATPase